MQYIVIEIMKNPIIQFPSNFNIMQDTKKEIKILIN